MENTPPPRDEPPRRTRPRARAAAQSEDTARTPRLDLAFILNESSPTSRRTVSLPQQRRRASPLHQTHRMDEDRMVQSFESPTWFTEDHKPPGDGWDWAATTQQQAADDRKADAPRDESQGDDEPKPREESITQETPSRPQEDDDEEEKADAQPTPRVTAVPTTTPLSREEKRRGRTCRVDGCDNYIVHKGLCCRHGGARKCSTDGCESTAKYMGLCWKHGGSTWCKVEGCSKRAKAKGKCWAHGGGTQCTHEACTKVAVSNGLCWAHGGGKRCLFDGCNRPGYERTNGFCDRHFDEMQHVNYFEV